MGNTMEEAQFSMSPALISYQFLKILIDTGFMN